MDGMRADRKSQAIFTVYCATMIYLTANGGAAHITDMAMMTRLIKVSKGKIRTEVDLRLTQ